MSIEVALNPPGSSPWIPDITSNAGLLLGLFESNLYKLKFIGSALTNKINIKNNKNLKNYHRYTKCQIIADKME